MLNKLILLFDIVFYYKKHRQMNTKVLPRITAVDVISQIKTRIIKNNLTSNKHIITNERNS